jgi:hypothetical protein
VLLFEAAKIDLVHALQGGAGDSRSRGGQVGC